LEQVHVTGLIRRGLRLELVAAISIALAVPAMALEGQNAATHTTLAVETRDLAGRTTANLAVAVASESGLPARGAVAISDNGLEVAGATLNQQGHATLKLDLAAGSHTLTAIYVGDAAHRASVSEPAHAEAQTVTTPDFQISVSPATLSLTPGQSGTVTASITPENASALTAPMFVTLSCSGLPDQSSCTFNPENVEILPNATAALTSSMVVLTQKQEGSIARPGSNGVALAILFPGALALGGFAWSVRRRAWLQRLTLLALVAFVSLLGATACNARYNYYNHGPPINPATPAGTYTVNVTAQSSNGVTATTHSTTLAFTVQ
jgi:hypothetical protein